METLSALLANCAGNWPVLVDFPAQRPVTRTFDVFFNLGPNKLLSKQSRGWWFEMSSCPLWRQCNVCIDCYHATDWFTTNDKKANPERFQFMILSSSVLDNIELALDGNTTIISENSVKMLRVIIDKRLTFNDHISSICSKAARQLNALARISK